MKPKDYKELLLKAVEKRCLVKDGEEPLDVPPMLVTGSPGIGKSAIVYEVCEDLGIQMKDIRLVQRDPTDLRGIPVPTPDGKARWLTSEELPTEGRGIIFLDEITSAPPLVQAMAYQLVFDRELGEYTVPEHFYIMGAGNRLEDRAVVHRMSTALNNRFVHILLEPDVNQWIDWAFNVGINPNIIGFIKWRGGDLLFNFDPTKSEKAFASPRTWDFAGTMMMVTPKKLLHEVLEGTVGKGAAAEFIAFLKVQTELPPLENIFNGEDFVPQKIDLKYALVSALATRATGAKQYNRLIEYSHKLPAEFSVLLVQMLASKGEDMVMKAPAFQGWVKEHSDVVISRKTL